MAGMNVPRPRNRHYTTTSSIKRNQIYSALLSFTNDRVFSMRLIKSTRRSNQFLMKVLHGHTKECFVVIIKSNFWNRIINKHAHKQTQSCFSTSSPSSILRVVRPRSDRQRRIYSCANMAATVIHTSKMPQNFSRNLSSQHSHARSNRIISEQYKLLCLSGCLMLYPKLIHGLSVPRAGAPSPDNCFMYCVIMKATHLFSDDDDKILRLIHKHAYTCTHFAVYNTCRI